MAKKYAFQLQLLFDKTVPDDFGNWQYAAANALDPISGVTAQLIATKRTNAFGDAAFPASMLTATILFPAQAGQVAPNMTLQGLHDLTTNNETGSVSAASDEHASQIGGRFSFEAATLTLTIFPPN